MKCVLGSREHHSKVKKDWKGLLLLKGSQIFLKLKHYFTFCQPHSFLFSWMKFQKLLTLRDWEKARKKRELTWGEEESEEKKTGKCQWFRVDCPSQDHMERVHLRVIFLLWYLKVNLLGSASVWICKCFNLLKIWNFN